MGSPFLLIFYAKDSVQASQAARQAFTLVDSLNQIFSDYIPHSSLSRLNATAGSGIFYQPPAALYQIIRTGLDAGRQSHGAFNIAVGPLSILWRAAIRQKHFPAADEIKVAVDYVNRRNILVDTVRHQVQLQEGMRLDLGGIAKGYVAEEVVRWLKSRNIRSALADAGGDIVCSAPPPGSKGWIVGINRPGAEDRLLEQTILLHDAAIATSGDKYQFLESQGKRYSHIIDPRTGYGVTFRRNVTIVSTDGTTADWLATACSVMSIRRAKKLASKNRAGLLITQEKKGRLLTYRNRLMKRFLNRQ
jgi:FAD:protein FMN transferase